MAADRKRQTGPPLRLGITLGDPAGIGPEIILEALSKPVGDEIVPVVFGHRGAFAHVLAQAEPRSARTKPNLSRIEFEEPAIPYESAPVGKSSATGGRLSLAYVEQAVEQALTGRIEAVVTAPISKESWALAGSSYRGHTVLLQDLCGVHRSVMMLLNPRLRVSLVTHHLPLREVPDSVTADLVEETIRITAAGLAEMGVPTPRIGVAGLNPHAGEEGLLGREEAERIAPAVRACQATGIGVQGPFPGDTVFHRAVAGEFDAVVAMYHDQGLAPLKTLAFAETVNVTLGLPIVRTSVGHGTAFDIAGRDLADPRSLLAAISLAARMARNRRASRERGDKGSS